LLRVHASNYRIVGFTEDVPIAPLAALAHARGLWAVDDVGSGALAPGRPANVAGEPTIAEGLAAGADLVLASGDKLLGGPQCGLILGSHAAVARVERDPLMRALRVDKLTLAALEATLRLALDPALANSRIPLWAFLNASPDAVAARAERLAGRFRDELGLGATVEATEAFPGGGSAPGEALRSWGVRLDPPPRAPALGEAEWARALRAGEPPVVPRVQGGAVLLDLRAVPEGDDGRLFDAIRDAAARLAARPEGPVP
jgi:L-seryl-tRNA(Ser) seleniumtransferase